MTLKLEVHNRRSSRDILTVNEKVNEKVHNTGKVSATVKNIHVDHNIEKDEVKGMQIAVEFESQNLKDEALYCMVRFYNDDGSPLVQQSNNKKYRSVNGNVIVGEYISPTYDNCKTRTTLFIPYEELPVKIKGRTDLILDASILHYTTNTDYEVLDRSKTYSFYIIFVFRDAAYPHQGSFTDLRRTAIPAYRRTIWKSGMEGAGGKYIFLEYYIIIII